VQGLLLLLLFGVLLLLQGGALVLWQEAHPATSE
jgi:hypothetical protein